MKHFPLIQEFSAIEPPEGSPESVAVLRALQLGDLLCAVPCFRAMKKAWPEAATTLVGLPWAKSFVSRFAKYLDGFQEFPGFSGIPERGFEPSRMRAFVAQGRSFDIGIQLHGDGSVTNRFLPNLNARLTAGFFPRKQKCPDPARFIPYPDGEPEIRRLLKLIHHLGIPLAGEDLEFPLTHADYHEANEISSIGRLRQGHYVCLHAGARDPKRRWPLDDFLEVGEALVARGFRIVLTGTSDESGPAAILRERLGASCLDLTGKTSLGALSALLKTARLVICNDTGISHLAVALDVPSVVIFSGSDPRRWAPLDTARHRSLGDPFVSPAVRATPRAVLREAFSLLGDSSLRLEARGGGFPVLPAVDWSGVRQVLLVHDGSEAETVALAPCISALRSRFPGFAFLTSVEGASVAPLLRGVHRLVLAEQGSLREPISEGPVRKVVDRLRAGSFDAAIIVTRTGQNPYTAAYICYLAGIPVRLGASLEFGGALLTHWVRKLNRSLEPEERHLALLRAAGLPSSPADSGLVVPPDVEARTRVRLNEAGVSPAHGFVLIDDGGPDWDGDGGLAGRLSNLTGMTVLHHRSFRSCSIVDWAAVVRASRLVVTAHALTSRLADAFGRPFVATGAAATASDGWRPRRSRAKLLTGPTASEDDLLQAVRTLLWIPKSRSQKTESQESGVRMRREVNRQNHFHSDS